MEELKTEVLTSVRIDNVVNNLDKIEALQEQIENLKQLNSSTLEEMSQDTNGKVLKHGNKFCSIRKRGSRYFLVRSDKPFGSHLRKSK